MENYLKRRIENQRGEYMSDDKYDRGKFLEIVQDRIGLPDAPYNATGEHIEKALLKEGYSWNSPIGEVEGGLGADSLDRVELVMALEEEFDIEITDQMAERYVNENSPLEKIYQFVKREKEKQN
jgi:acyl carrier protein